MLVALLGIVNNNQLVQMWSFYEAVQLATGSHSTGSTIGGYHFTDTSIAPTNVDWNVANDNIAYTYTLDDAPYIPKPGVE